MSVDEEMSDKKRALLAYKNKLLNDVHYCEKRIEEIGKKQNQTYDDDGDSSDSDTGVLLPVKRGPTAHQLRAETSKLNLCLQATQELTSLQVLESEVNVLVDPPKLKDGNYPDEEGVWREALAECKVDLIPYCITFYIFQPSKRFGSPSYYQLRVTPTKGGHEKELRHSILSKLTRPSDAWQVLKSYSTASRSRRSTMARLCDKFGDAIVVGAAEDGGFTIKCANLLEISWSLQNIWSPVMPFQHKMKFDLEYMDEHYIKTIKHAHKQLSDPSLQIDERTEILTTILNTCIEASGNISSVTESETDQSVNLTPVKRRTTLEEEPVIPVKRRTLNKGGAEAVMPPPKGVPKKTKTKDKENVNLNRNGLELQENTGSSKNKGLVKDNLNKDDNSKTKKDEDINRDRLKSNERVSKDKVTDNVKGNAKAKPKEIAKEKSNSNNLKKNKEQAEEFKSKVDKPVKDSEITSKLTTEGKQKKNSQAKETNAKDDNVITKKAAGSKPNEKTEKSIDNRKKTSTNHKPVNNNMAKEIHQKTKEDRQKSSERPPKLKENRSTSKDNRPKTTENKTQQNKNEEPAHDKQKQKDNRQKQPEAQQKRPETHQKRPENRQKLNENRHKTNENVHKQNDNDKQNYKGKNDTKKQDKPKAVSKIPKLFKDNFIPQNFISKRLSGRIDKNANAKEKNYNHLENKLIKKNPINKREKINVERKDVGTKQNDKFGIKSDKYRLIGKSKVLPSSSGHLRKQ